MSPSREGGCLLDRRRFVLGAGALASAGLVELGMPSAAGAEGRPRTGVDPAPEPIPGGIQIPEGPSSTCSRRETRRHAPLHRRHAARVRRRTQHDHGLQGFERGRVPRRHRPWSRRHMFNLETDMRAFQGEFVVDGVTHRGRVRLRLNRSLRPRFGVASARLQRQHPSVGAVLDPRRATDCRRLQDDRTGGRCSGSGTSPVIDSFQFLGPNVTPAAVDFRTEWRTSGPAVSRGLGDTVAPTDPAAFLGEIAPAVSTISCSGEEIGFEFESNGQATTDLQARCGAGRRSAPIATASSSSCPTDFLGRGS